MSMSTNLFSAILSMDAYNRGYGASLPGLSDAGGTKLGNATVLSSDGGSAAQSVGFYAIAYSYNGQTVISYRGTDNPALLGNASDIWNGWVGGAGALSEQAIRAEDFYDKVTGKSIVSGSDNNVLLVGHSLGGGLAGYIASLTNEQAVIFDNMPYAAAALNYSIAFNGGLGMTDFSSFLSGVNTPGYVAYPSAAKITSIETTGEVLAAVRGAAVTLGSVVELGTATGLLTKAEGVLKALRDAPIAVADSIAIQSGETAINLDSNAGLSNPVKLHSMALLVLLQYASDNGLTAWSNIPKKLFDAYFDDAIGGALGLSAAQMLTEIAYSAISEGAKPFGDTGIRALFQQADALGTLYSTADLPDLLLASNVQADLTNISVEYAGDLAKNADTSSAHANGAVTVDGTNGALTADFSSAIWTINGHSPSQIVGKSDFISTVAKRFAALPVKSNIDEVVLNARTTSGGALSASADLSSTDGALIVGDTGDNSITGSLGNDLLIGAGGTDTIDGGAGSDTAYFSGAPINYDIVHNGDNSWTISSARGGAPSQSDTLTNVEYASFGTGEQYALTRNGILDQIDFSFVIDTTGSMNPYIQGVKNDANALINYIFGGGDFDAHISVVSFKDPAIGDPDSVVLPFTTEIQLADRQQAAISAINSLYASGGGDTPEGDYSGLLLALDGSAGQWRDSASVRRIALFTDAPVKDFDLQSTVDQYAHDLGVTIVSSSVEAAPVGAVATFAFSASESGAAAFSVEIYTIQVGYDSSATASVQQIATDNGGQFFQAPSPDNLISALTSIVSQVQIAGTVSGQTGDDSAPIAPFAGAGVIEPTADATETLTVTPSSIVNGHFSNLGGGTVDPTTGVYSITGTVADVNAALENLEFIPTPHQVAPGQTVETDFIITDTNSKGSTATDSSTSIFITAYGAVEPTDRVASEIELLYRTILGRSSDAGGLAHYTALVEQGGMTLPLVAADMIYSAEFTAAAGAPDDAALLTLLGQNSYGAAPTPGSAEDALLRAGEASIGGGLSRFEVAVALALDPTHQSAAGISLAGGVIVSDVTGAFVTDAVSSGGEAYLLAHAAFGSAATPLTLEELSASLESGASLSDAAGGALGSAAYVSLYGTQDDTHFLDSIYQNALGRAPDSGGLTHYSDLLAGGESRAEVAVDIALSLEHRADVQATLDAGIYIPSAVGSEVARLYQGVLGRAPDLLGLEHYVDMLSGGPSLPQVAAEMLGSGEALAKYGVEDDATFLNNIYENALGRAPDAGGLSHYLGQLESGIGRDALAVDITLSPEGRLHLAPQIEVGVRIV